jgi:uncharacterized membrane protein
LLKRLTVITQYTVLIMALVMIAIGTVEAFFLGLRVLLVPAAAFWKGQEVWLRFARWRIAALTFQLAADVAETTVTPTWKAIGRLAAIAAIRTFLNFFVERDLREVPREKGLSSRPWGPIVNARRGVRVVRVVVPPAWLRQLPLSNTDRILSNPQRRPLATATVATLYPFST